VSAAHNLAVERRKYGYGREREFYQGWWNAPLVMHDDYTVGRWIPASAWGVAQISNSVILAD
jgi:hypothetical protein